MTAASPTPLSPQAVLDEARAGRAPLAATLSGALRLLEHLDGQGPTFIESRKVEREVSFAELMLAAASAQSSLEAHGLGRGERVGIITSAPQRFLSWFLGAVRGGFVPVALAQPVGAAGVQRALGMLEAAEAAALVCSDAKWSEFVDAGARPSLQPISDQLPEAPSCIPPAATVSPDDPCLLQFSSGTTAFPKPLEVTHRNLVANATLIVTAIASTASDKGVSWLPMHHDMGLIGMALSPLLFARPVVFMPPSRFVRSPEIWMEAVSRHRGTVTFGPNFAMDLAARRADPAKVRQLDLGCLRLLGCGAEPVRFETMQRFFGAYAAAGLRWEAIVPSYGLAEATLAVSFDVGRGPRRLLVDRQAYETRGVVVPAPVPEKIADEQCLSIVSCGKTNTSHAIAIFDGDRRLPENEVGEVAFRGESVVKSSNHGVVDPSGWLRTGDLGFLNEGSLYVAGRKKEVIIVNGRNFLAHEIEWTAAECAGVHAHQVLATAVSTSATEDVLLLYEASPQQAVSSGEIVAHVQARLGVTIRQVERVAPGSLPRTTSGKLRRSIAKQMWLEGKWQKDTPNARNEPPLDDSQP